MSEMKNVVDIMKLEHELGFHRKDYHNITSLFLPERDDSLYTGEHIDKLTDLVAGLRDIYIDKLPKDIPDILRFEYAMVVAMHRLGNTKSEEEAENIKTSIAKKKPLLEDDIVFKKVSHLFTKSRKDIKAIMKRLNTYRSLRKDEHVQEIITTLDHMSTNLGNSSKGSHNLALKKFEEMSSSSKRAHNSFKRSLEPKRA
jgi:hypothetical protein